MGKKRGGAVRVKQVGPKGPKNPMDMMPTMEDFAIKPEDQIHLPPTPDRNYSIVWPMTETFTMKTDTGFQVIYPSYLDAEKTVKQGRRVCQDKAVRKPTVSDISLGLQSLKIRHVLQPYKGYSRDPATIWDNPGRVLVDMSGHTKGQLMLELAARIPELPERRQRLQAEAEQAAEQEKKLKEQKQIEAAKKAPAAASASKKKGKKGRKK
uniref:Signal recognition particle 19 kDa protein n=1 Tax=Amphora coffeiformis TaxID=265554 RepID=A0A7S3L659_9STRA|mmetsp:Transcript_19996/g.37919  ORF Transcript_19996/g.37919 Transcript_19996/m.37919 type:complete len:209 (+) Transcript_19996:107-733(+)